VQSKSPIGLLSELSASSFGVFTGTEATERGVSRKQLGRLRAHGEILRVLPDTYRILAVPPSSLQHLRAALLWAGADAAAAGRSAGELYGLEGVTAEKPEIVVPPSVRATAEGVSVRHTHDRASLMLRHQKGFPVTGVECTLLTLAALLDEVAFEIACEDARRRRLTSVPALRAYLQRYGRPGRLGVRHMRRLLRELDPQHPARSTLEVMTRRLLVAHGITGFVREFPLEWHSRTYFYDFAFERERTILETNGRRWHDDATDYEHNNEKWSVPGRHGYRIVFATWEKVTRHPIELLADLAAALHA
jgi:very-short-patch-repair endonuclease